MKINRPRDQSNAGGGVLCGFPLIYFFHKCLMDRMQGCVCLSNNQYTPCYIIILPFVNSKYDSQLLAVGNDRKMITQMTLLSMYMAM